MTDRQQIVDQLNEPLDQSKVKTRTQGATVSYVEGFHVTSEANRIFGHDGWTYRVDWTKEVQSEQDDKKNWRVGYTAQVTASVTIGDKTFERTDVGFGQGILKDIGLAHESAIKEAVTDARKRAMHTLGYTFGLALYDKTHEKVGRGAKKAASLNGGEKRPADVKAREVFAKVGGRADEFDAWVAGVGDKRLAYGAIAKAHETGMSLDDALRELANA